MSAPESKSEVVLALAEEFLERYRRGERPSLKEYIDGHPQLAAVLRAHLTPDRPALLRAHHALVPAG